MLKFDVFGGITLLVKLEDMPTLSSQRKTVAGLLTDYFGHEVRVGHHASGAPYLIDENLHISISHCSKGVAIALGHQPTGVDIEHRGERLRGLAQRFMPEWPDPSDYQSSDFLLTAWTFKEAAFKTLQDSPQPPEVITRIPFPARQLRSATIHLPHSIAVTVATFKE